ncbi:histidine--tRNA ligase [Candidatus Saccharibacteria bacterium]|nr:histidine--tRNA ligase [Candidatus Saccharibacteria bacterium]
MKKFNTSPISGMQELLPEKQAIFNDYKSKIAEVYHLHGFLNIETPTIDRNEILFAKAGGDTEKQIYRVIKTDESAEDSTESLRFDHTVPLARYVVEHESDLHFPFRVSQIGRNFRGERPQKGRYRELYQCDVDVVGRNTLPIFYDAQVIYTFVEAVKSFVKTPVLVRINNRKFVSGFIEAIGAVNQEQDINSIIDHSEKVPAEKTLEYLHELGLTEDTVVKITTFIDTKGSVDDIKSMLDNMGLEYTDDGLDNLSQGLAQLEIVSADLIEMGLNTNEFVIDMKIVRGLDYYTGTVFEGLLPEHPEVGSIGGGGRYDNLASNFTDQRFPGVGASIGLTRLFYILNESGLVDKETSAPIDYAIIPLDASAYKTAYQLAGKFRGEGQSATIIPVEKKLGDAMKVAASIAKKGIVLGEDEVKNGSCKVKDFSTGDQTPLELK